MGGDFISYLVGGEAVLTVGLDPSALHGDVVGAFGLVEVGGTVVAVPEGLVFFEVFDEEAVGGDVVAVDGQAIVGRVDVPAGPAGGVAVVSAPEPDVVEEDVVGVDRDAVLGGGGGGGAADTAGDVEEGGWVGGVVGVATMGANDEEGRGGFGAGVEEDSADGDAGDVGDYHGWVVGCGH